MQIRTFRVPFAEIVGPDATELDFGPDDYLVVRPLFGLSKTALEGWQARFGDISAAIEKSPAKAGALSSGLTLDVIAATVIEWHLSGPDGVIAQPSTPSALDALPGAVASTLLPFLAGYRGSVTANPTTSG